MMLCRPLFRRSLPSVLLVAVLARVGYAQEIRSVPVDGHPMNVQVSGLDHVGKTPTVVFEAGGGSTLKGWGAIPTEVATFAPVIAYDRTGFGGSESDGQ